MSGKGGRLLINATGVDRIKLWYLHGGKLEYETHENISWIFVTGTPYDLDFLESQLEIVPYVRISRDSMPDIFGRKEGIKIHLRPSKIKDIVFAINRIGSGRKYQIYNADVNPVLRFISLKGLAFFALEDPLNMEPEIPSVSIYPVMRKSHVKGFMIDGAYFDHVDCNSLGVLEARIRESFIVVYRNEMNSVFKLLDAAERLGFEFPRYRKTKGSSYESYGRVMYKSDSLKMAGKICIPSDSFIHSESGLHGICQVSRISSLPPETAAIVTPGTAVSSLEESYALKKGILIPLYKNDHETEKTLDELFTMDRGGIALQPDPGIYEDVYEIDFSSMYPSIIVRYNLSPETISEDHGFKIPESRHFIDHGKRGFLSEALEHLLNTRLLYKSVRDQSSIYTSRDAALKWLLLTSFGYTGYKNAKFGRIEVHEAITSIGRWALSRAISIAHEFGFEVIHGIVDSLWLRGGNDIKGVLGRIKNETGIDIVLEGHYKWIVFFPSESGLGAVNRYTGLKADGTYKFRGIELRRNDIPEFCKKFQIEGLEILGSCSTAMDIREKESELADLKKKYLGELWKAESADLQLNVVPSKRLSDYRVNGLQKRTLEEFDRAGIEIQPGQATKVVVTSWKKKMLSIDPEEKGFDREYYRKLLLRSFRMFDFIFSVLREQRKPNLYDPEYSRVSPQEP